MLSGRTVRVRKAVLVRYGLAVVLGTVALTALGWLLWRAATSGPSEAEVAAILHTQLGGDTTVTSTNRNSFALAAANLNSQERLTFEIGDSFFTQNWVTAPASTEARDGLGPTFNAQSCSSCHTLDGRAQPPADNDDPERGLLFRLSIPGIDPVTGGPLPDPVYGGQLQDRAILTVPPEGRFLIDYREVPGTYEDGTPYSLLKPEYSFADLAFGPTHPDLLFSPRIAPAVFGGGLLEAIPEADILAAADPDDANGDGISGRANMVWSVRAGDTRMGRFGWKANVPTLEQQIAGAFHGDIGITSPLFESENCPTPQADCREALNGGTPEIPGERLAKVVFYNRTLGVPAMRDVDDPQVREGARLFLKAGCAACHTPSHTTGEHPVPALTGQTIFPYTDLLLHDMGEGLADGRPDFLANGREWRTPPLWGIGLIENVNNHTRLLHDGRARDMAEAILWHDGEGLAAREEFRKMSREEREAVIRFLESL